MQEKERKREELHNDYNPIRFGGFPIGQSVAHFFFSTHNTPRNKTHHEEHHFHISLPKHNQYIYFLYHLLHHHMHNDSVDRNFQ
jgi:hypothetical protein